MHQFRSVLPIEAASTPQPTYDSLIKHFKKWGLSTTTGYRGKEVDYSTYTKLSKDPLVEVAFDFLGQNDYALFVVAVGYPHMEFEAREDWNKSRGILDNEDEV